MANQHPIGVLAIFDDQPNHSFTSAARRQLEAFTRLIAIDFEVMTGREQFIYPPKPQHEHVAAAGARKARNRTSTIIGSDGARVRQLSRATSSPHLKYSPQRSQESIPDLPKTSIDDILESYDRSEDVVEPPIVPISRRKSTSGAYRSSLAIEVPRSHKIPQVVPQPRLLTPPDTPPGWLEALRGKGKAAKRAEHSIVNGPLTPEDSEKDEASIAATMSATDHRTRDDASSSEAEYGEHFEIKLGNLRSFVSLDEIQAAMHLISQKLHYDLVYILRLHALPRHPNGDDANVGMELICAVGATQPEPPFQYVLHHRALNSRKGVIYHDAAHGSSAVGPQSAFPLGLLLPVLRSHKPRDPPTDAFESSLSLKAFANPPSPEREEKSDREFTEGVVFGCFKKLGTATDVEAAYFKNGEVSFLRHIGGLMGPILRNMSSSTWRMRQR